MRIEWVKAGNENRIIALVADRQSKEKRIASEAGFWLRLKRELVSRGFDVIKREPGKDGHLTGAPWYIRSRKRGASEWAVHDTGFWQVREPIHLQFNAGIAVRLEVAGRPELQDRRLRCRVCNGATMPGLPRWCPTCSNHQEAYGTPCANHIDRPGECPQAHICERCGAPLAAHISASMLCPTGSGSFSANAATRAKFPEQYPSVTSAPADS